MESSRSLVKPDIAIVDLMPTITQITKGSSIVLELGCFNGAGSTRAFLDGVVSITGKVISVDLNKPEVPPKDDRWVFIKGDTTNPATLVLVKSELGYKTPDVIFIDTIHTYDQMRKELELFGELSRDKCIWLFHDTWMHGKYNTMTDAIKEYAEKNNLEYEDVTKESHGLGMMKHK